MVYFSTSTFFPNVFSFELSDASFCDDDDGFNDGSDDARVKKESLPGDDDDDKNFLLEKLFAGRLFVFLQEEE